MRRIEAILRNETNQLKKIIEKVQKRLKNAPNGHLRISKSRGRVEYYFKDEECSAVRKNGRYMRANERKLAKSIAQRDYDMQVLKMATERVKAIETFLRKYERSGLKEMYQKMNHYRKELIEPVEISDEEYLKQWQTVEYERKPIINDTQVIVTERGERVRSKSEKIIADKLNMLGIPYRYECPILLDGNIKVYPDFTILRLPEREEVYLEHFGMMDDMDYLSKTMHKLSTYERNGIYLGVNLFITYETSTRPINTKVLDEVLRALFV
ncbi:MAG: hypothetical protein IKU39_08150 [Lachnospiraceae bacterium]|nr:hypothetical protein [Lachnospiraceae bacterium]